MTCCLISLLKFLPVSVSGPIYSLVFVYEIVYTSVSAYVFILLYLLDGLLPLITYHGLLYFFLLNLVWSLLYQWLEHWHCLVFASIFPLNCLLSFHSICDFVSELHFLEATDRWILVFNPSSYSVSFLHFLDWDCLFSFTRLGFLQIPSSCWLAGDELLSFVLMLKSMLLLC